nr:hypothetical protein Iba_chr01bCG10690 [Ipomoea batatas]
MPSGISPLRLLAHKTKSERFGKLHISIGIEPLRLLKLRSIFLRFLHKPSSDGTVPKRLLSASIIIVRDETGVLEQNQEGTFPVNAFALRSSTSSREQFFNAIGTGPVKLLNDTERLWQFAKLGGNSEAERLLNDKLSTRLKAARNSRWGGKVPIEMVAIQVNIPESRQKHEMRNMQKPRNPSILKGELGDYPIRAPHTIPVAGARRGR